MTQKTYAKETKTALFQGKPITVTHLTPILSPDERAKIKREIEHQLYDVFIKYHNSNKKAG
jgi:hypothetical protein